MEKAKKSNILSKSDTLAKDETTVRQNSKRKLVNNTENTQNDGDDGIREKKKFDNNTENIPNDSMQTLESKDLSQENVESANDGVDELTPVGLGEESEPENGIKNIDDISMQTLESKDLSQKNVESVNDGVGESTLVGLGEENKFDNNTGNIPNDGMQTLESKDLSQENVEPLIDGVAELTPAGLEEESKFENNTENIPNDGMQTLESIDLSQENVELANDEVAELTLVGPREENQLDNNTNNKQSNNNVSLLKQTLHAEESSIQLMSPLEVYRYLRNSKMQFKVTDKSKVKMKTKKVAQTNKIRRTQKAKLKKLHNKSLKNKEILPLQNLQQGTQSVSQSQGFDKANCLENPSYHLNNTNRVSVTKIQESYSRIVSNNVIPLVVGNGIKSSVIRGATSTNNAACFHTLNNIDSDEFICNNLTIAIVEENPRIHPSPEINFDILKILINRQIDQIPDGYRLPKFNSSKVKDGFLLITAAEKFSRKWLTDIIPKLKLKPNVTLKAIPINELKQFYESKIVINNENNVDIALNRLRRQNLDVNLTSWNLHSVERLPNGKAGMVLSFEIPAASFELLRAKKFKLFYGIERVNLLTNALPSFW